MKVKQWVTMGGRIIAVGLGVGMLLLGVAGAWIGYEVKSMCEGAIAIYGQDCGESLSLLVADEKQSFGRRNRAIWAIGQLGEKRALPTLQKYYTGVIPEREPLNAMISQYELKKAVKLAEGGTNLLAFMWRGIF